MATPPFRPSPALAAKIALSLSGFQVKPDSSLVREQVGSRVEQFLATLAQRAAAVGGTTMWLCNATEPSPSFRLGLAERLGLPVEAPVVSELSTEFFHWLVDDCQGAAMTPWGVLRDEPLGITLDAAGLKQPSVSSWQPATRVEYKDPVPTVKPKAPTLLHSLTKIEAAAAAIARPYPLPPRSLTIESGALGSLKAAAAIADADESVTSLSEFSDAIEEKFKGSL